MSFRMQDRRIDKAMLHNVEIRGAYLTNVAISGELENVTVNGVDIGPLVQAELDRREPQRKLLRATTPAGLREAWNVVEARWAATVARARTLDESLLHESVDGEWSFIETQRHLLYATDIWVRRVLQGDPAPFHPLDLPYDEAADAPGVPRDRNVRPSLDEVLALRRDRMDGVRQVLDGLTGDYLTSSTTPVEGPGWPPADSYPVLECLQTVLNEEWCHRDYAERDLGVLTADRGPDHRPAA
ncbi:DinB family protein [Symbioplanes lichenis]|uniref:DinB family protein n=1 Tax=Symbioplanes lichenis TaxID=1629072 RepID=UPI0027390F82|nr:DinB family protein [Actinoplanes lichenis]